MSEASCLEASGLSKDPKLDPESNLNQPREEAIIAITKSCNTSRFARVFIKLLTLNSLTKW
jgi:hypothetical protein